MQDPSNIIECIDICKKLLDEKNLKDKVLNNKNSKEFHMVKATINLYDFMNKIYYTNISQIEILEYILNYIKINHLQDKNNPKYIILDEKLKNLFNIQDKESITYFNIQKYICSLYKN